LSQYLALFRARAGGRAQLAATMVCFDLARLGSESAQREFMVLAPTILGLAKDEAMVEGLLAGDDYLEQIWIECKLALELGDPRELSAGRVEDDVELVGSIELLDGDELFLEIVDDGEETERQQVEFAKAVDDYLGYDPENDSWGSGDGFATDDSVDLGRFEQFLAEASSRSELVPVARGVRCLGNLFMAMHLRRHTIFGKPNPRRRSALQAGLQGLATDVHSLAYAAALFENEGEGVVKRFQKVSELLLDFFNWCARKRCDPKDPVAVAEYIAEDREPPPLLLKDADNRRRR
jgi:hypothetical protein